MSRRLPRERQSLLAERDEMLSEMSDLTPAQQQQELQREVDVTERNQVPPGVSGNGPLSSPIPDSILVDAAGRTTDEVFSEVLRLLGVDLPPGKRSRWRTALRRQNAGRLLCSP